MDTTTNTQTEHTVTSANDKSQDRPTFYTVAEAARLLRVDPATIYRASAPTPSRRCGSGPGT